MDTDLAPTPTGLSSYDELVGLLEALPLLVREKRRRRGLSLRAAADQTGVSYATILRCEQGEKEVSLTNATILLRWLGDAG